MLTAEKQLDIISRAWGDEEGYCFFSSVRGDANTKQERIQSWRDKGFHWPTERADILQHIKANHDNDLYWCPVLFDKKDRKRDLASDEQALWADLDEVDPREIDERYRPTIAWETSPGRFQALWILRSIGDSYHLSWPGGENQALTYFLGADNSGWDTTQMMRIPGWRNHKPDRRDENGGEPWEGNLLWNTTRRYSIRDFDDIPRMEQRLSVELDVVEDQLASINRAQVWDDIRYKLPSHIRDYILAREATGDRSEVLWQIERELADRGLNALQIVSIVRDTVWNKYEGRGDELRRLITEASKAIGEKSEVVQEVIEERPDQLQSFKVLFANVKPPDWLIQDIWNVASCGFIAGQPKSYKSWFGLDMALSIATGYPFLGRFKVVAPGPVLYIQEEDSLPLLKQRYDTMMKDAKEAAFITHEADGIYLNPLQAVDADPQVYGLVRRGFQVSDATWLDWLDRQLESKNFQAVILDPLMMIQGNVDDHRAGEMTDRVFKPMKQLADKHQSAFIVIHHMKKGDGNGQRGGQMMLGSVANHAWAEDSIYVTHTKGKLHLEVESKFAAGGTYEVSGIKRKKGWTPYVDQPKQEDADDGPEIRQATSNGTTKIPRVVTAMRSSNQTSFTVQDIQHLLHLKVPSSAHRQLNRAVDKGYIHRIRQGITIRYTLEEAPPA